MIALKENTPMLVAPDGTPIPRIVGSETELAFSSDPRFIRELTTEEVIRYGAARAIAEGKPVKYGPVSPSTLFMKALGVRAIYDEEGYRLYQDVGDHPEFGTPEHIHFRCLANAVLRGYVKIGSIFGEAADRFREEGIDIAAVVIANNSDPSGTVWGHHESLLTRRALGVADFADAFIANYVSRIVWAGAGAILPKGGGGFRYALSQRAEHIWDEMSSATTRGRPFINTRDESLASDTVFRRVHGIHGESVFSPVVMALRMASKSIILRACELGVSFESLRPEEPMNAIRQISADPELKAKIKIHDGRYLTGIQLNREVAERALDAIREVGYLTPEEDEFGDLWLNLLTLLEEKGPHSEECRRMLDWVVKQEYLDKYMASNRRNGLTDYEAAWKVERAYHSIFPNEGIGLRRVRQGLFDGSPSDDILDNGQPLPPTRAQDRGWAARVLRASGLEYTLDWETVSMSTRDEITGVATQLGRVLLKDPYEQHNLKLAEMFATYALAA